MWRPNEKNIELTLRFFILGFVVEQRHAKIFPRRWCSRCFHSSFFHASIFGNACACSTAIHPPITKTLWKWVLSSDHWKQELSTFQIPASHFNVVPFAMWMTNHFSCVEIKTFALTRVRETFKLYTNCAEASCKNGWSLILTDRFLRQNRYR